MTRLSSMKIALVIAVAILAPSLAHAQVACTGLTISPSSLPPSAVGATYGPVQLSASASAPLGLVKQPVTFTEDGRSPLPPGLTLVNDGRGNATVSGRPTLAGTFTTIIGAQDSGLLTLQK